MSEAILNITDSAREKILNLMKRENQSPDGLLRVSIVGGGCSGLSYKMEFIPEAQANDRQFSCNGLNVVVDQKSALFLEGLRLDYQDGLNGAGFVYENPKAKKSCGCGTSFAV